MTDQLPSKTIFRRYDIRGIVGSTLTSNIVRQIGKSYAALLLEKQEAQVVVARDGRLSSPAFADAFIQALLDSGMDVVDLGAVPTPLAYFAMHHLNIGNSAIITGSHNPGNYNGIKLNVQGSPLHSEQLSTLYARIQQQKYVIGKGQMTSVDITDIYQNEVLAGIQLERPLKIAIDCGNGIAGIAAPALFKAMGCDVTELYCEPDGTFPNHHPNPSEPKNLETLRTVIREGDFDLGLAFDGDGDRLGVIDSEGEIIWPDRQMMLFSRDILAQNPGGKIVFDVKSSCHLASEISRHKGEPLMWSSGHSLIRQKMQDCGAIFGGELSGHLFFADRWYGFDDGLYSAARMLEIVASQVRPSAEIFAELPNGVNTPEISVGFESERSLKDFMDQLLSRASEFNQATVNRIDGLRVDYADGWGLARESHTTPSLSLRFEGTTQVVLERIQSKFKHELLCVQSNLQLPF